MARIIHFTALTLVTACWLSSVGCSSSNDPAGPSSTAGTTSTAAGTTSVTPAGGTDSGTGGTTGIAGTSSSVGGTAAGGTPATGTGGMTTAADFVPLCAGLTTAATGSPAPTKGGACTATDPQSCWKTCGPSSTGFKSETCTNGAYVEQSGCTFPTAADYSCYKVPTTVDPSCPTTPPQASQVCNVATCTPCSAGGAYLDSTGASKVGYCVCPEPSATTGMSKWSCASTTAWPCPMGSGC